MTKPSEKKTKVDSRFWLVPPEIYEPLDKEFHFDFDPCPYPFTRDGIDIEWGQTNWVNPPFRKADAINGHGPTAFVRKAIEEQQKGKTSVLILPVQGYVNYLVEAGAELRSVGRVKWVDAINGGRDKQPSNNALFVLRGIKHCFEDPRFTNLVEKQALEMIWQQLMARGFEGELTLCLNGGSVTFKKNKGE